MKFALVCYCKDSLILIETLSLRNQSIKDDCVALTEMEALFRLLLIFPPFNNYGGKWCFCILPSMEYIVEMKLICFFG